MFTRVGVNIVDHQFSDYILIEDKNRIIEFKFNENDVLMFISCCAPRSPILQSACFNQVMTDCHQYAGGSLWQGVSSHKHPQDGGSVAHRTVANSTTLRLFKIESGINGLLFNAALGLGRQWRVAECRFEGEPKRLELRLERVPGEHFECSVCKSFVWSPRHHRKTLAAYRCGNWSIALLTSRAQMLCRLGSLPSKPSFRTRPPAMLPRSNCFLFARRVLELSSHAGTLPLPELQSSLMRLAIDAITQAEGAAPAAVAPPPPSAPCHCCYPATPLPTPPTQTQPPQPPPTPQQPAQPTQQPQIVAAPAPTSTPMPVDGQTPDGHDVRIMLRRPARTEKSQHRQGRSQARKGAGIPCHPQHLRHRKTRQIGR